MSDTFHKTRSAVFSCLSTLEIIKDLSFFLNKNGIDSLLDPEVNLRPYLFDFFKTNQFKENYFKLAIEAANFLNLDKENILLQKAPTARIFKPGTHGTSFHCDFWYGHGKDAITVWTPLTDVNEGNSFHVIKGELNKKYYDQLEKNKGFSLDESELLSNSEPVLIKQGQSFCFTSDVIHGSPLNTSKDTRISFDFRIAIANDSSSTKDLITYYKFNGKSFVECDERFLGMNFLKYICGGQNKSPLAQHGIIESVSKEYGIKISAQEAEVERFGQPIFDAYLDSLAKSKGFDALRIASESVLSKTSLSKALRSETKVYCALENKFLSYPR